MTVANLNYWEFGSALAAILVPAVVLIYNQVNATKWAQHHQGIMRIWGLADDIATRIIAQLGTNPSADTKAQVIAAGVAELKGLAAQALTQVVGGTTDADLTQLLATKVEAKTQVIAAVKAAVAAAVPAPSLTVVKS